MRRTSPFDQQSESKERIRRPRPYMAMWALFALAFLLLCRAPAQADVVLMSKAGFDHWLQQKTIPVEQKVSRLESQTAAIEYTLESWEKAHFHRMYLWLDNTTVEHYTPGGLPAGNTRKMTAAG